MKRFILFALAYNFSVFVLPLSLCAQDGDATFPNYVVIGAFAHEENAVNFTDEAKHNRYPARFEMNPNRNLYYVYVLTTDDREYARAEALRLRAETKYFDAWVYSGFFGNIDVATFGVGAEQHDFNPVTGQRLENVSAGGQQRTTARSSVVAGAASNERLTTGNANRLIRNDSAPPHNNVTREDDRPDQQSGAGAEKQHAEGDERDEQTALSSDVAQNTDTAQGQVATTSVTNTRKGTSVQQGIKPSQDNQKQETGIAGNPERQESTADATSITVANKSSAKATASNVQQTSAKSQGADSPNEADASRETDDENISETVVNIPAPIRQSTAPLTSEEVVGKNFYFHLYRADNEKTVPGEVDAIDFEKSRKMGTYPANEGVKVTMAGGKMKHISFVCQVFGYRKQQQEFDPENPSELLYLDDKENLVVPFELVRLQKGDIAIMYNVFFFKDAAVMRPESRYEVNNLLGLLVENPSYNIVIHGHTNGNASGKIIRMDKPGNFYSLSGTKQGFGSAKQLSEERALVIREFLISSGISADRMQVKAWGGKKPIHDKHSVRAQENVRVEIEILSQ